MKTRAERRYIDTNKALRKRRIDKECSPVGWDAMCYDNLHQYSKNKIHCSCPLCSDKTTNRYAIGSKINYKHSDKIKIEALESQIKEGEIDIYGIKK